jgi:hypothetical protein
MNLRREGQALWFYNVFAFESSNVGAVGSGYAVGSFGHI